MPIIPNSKRTHEELSAMGKKGGLASGIVRRRRKMIKEIAGQCAEVYFMDLYSFAHIMGLRNPAALEWLIMEIIGGLRKEHKDDLITVESLLEMGFTRERAKDIAAKYRSNATVNHD